MSSELFGKYTVKYAGDKAGTLTVSQNGLMTAFDCLCACDTSQILKLAVLSGGDLKVLGVMTPEGGKLKLYKKYSKNDLSQISLYNIEDTFLISEEEVKMSSDIQTSIFTQMVEAEAKAKAEAERANKLEAKPKVAVSAVELEKLGGESVHYMVPKPEVESVSDTAANEYSESKEKLAQPTMHTFAGLHSAATPDDRVSAKSVFDMKEGKWQPANNPKIHFNDQDLREACENITGALEKVLETGVIQLAIPFKTDKPFPLMPIFCFGETMRIGGENYLVFCLKDGSLYL